MIRFTTIPLKHQGVLEDNVFHIPESPGTEDFLNNYAKVYHLHRASVDPELDLYNFVADTWPFLSLTSR